MWPPPYDVSLKYEETFVVDESLEKSELDEVYDEELVYETNLQQKKQKDKFFMLHNIFKTKRKNIYKTKFEKKRLVFENEYPDQEEPFEGHIFKDFGNQSLSNDGIHKRDSNSKQVEDESYDYKNLKNEFDKNIKEAEKTENLTNTETTTSSLSRVFLNKLMPLKDNSSQNCSYSDNFSLTSIGCLISDASILQTRSRAVNKLILILTIWICVYLIIAIPLWCQYGWCCCCCRCKFCRPVEQIEDVKKFFAINPLGVYHDHEGTKYEYKPTAYEKYAHKNLEQALQSL